MRSAEFFPGIFPCLCVVRLAAGAGAASVPPAPTCVTLRRPVASRSRSLSVPLVPRWCRTRPHILVALRHPSQKTSTIGQRNLSAKMADARRDNIGWKNPRDTQPTADRATDFTPSTCLLQSEAPPSRAARPTCRIRSTPSHQFGGLVFR